MGVQQEINFDKNCQGQAEVNIFLSMKFTFPAEMDDMLRVLKDARAWLLKQKEREVGEPL